MKYFGTFCLVMQVITLGTVATADSHEVKNSMDVMMPVMTHLEQYGYLADYMQLEALVAAVSDGKMQPLQTALRRYQRAFGLPETGQLDEETLTMMHLPRCGMTDEGMMDSMGNKRRKRFAVQGSKWPRTDLTFRIERYSTDLAQDVVHREIRRAFDAWSSVTPLRFFETAASNADIRIVFGARSHGDPYPFDGRGGVLAHAFYPSSGGDAHFDEDETWTINTSSGTNLFQVALHEFGHSLGLAHSSVRGSIMFPSYTGYRPGAGLHADDVNGITQIYGSRQQPTTTTTTTMTPKTTTTTTTTTTRKTTSITTTRRSEPGIPDACSVSQWDAVLTTLNGRTYFFKGEYYFEKGSRTARRISSDWPGINGRIDAALTMRGGYSLLIQGEHFAVFRDKSRYDFARRTIGDYFGMLTPYVDAGWTWARDQTFYLVRGSQIWRNNNDYRLDATYPRAFSSEFPGAPGAIDAATKDASGTTHFFKGRYYYTLDDNTRSVRHGPRSTADHWFDCSGGQQSGLTSSEPNEPVNRLHGSQMEQAKAEFEEMLADKDTIYNVSSGSAQLSSVYFLYLFVAAVICLYV